MDRRLAKLEAEAADFAAAVQEIHGGLERLWEAIKRVDGETERLSRVACRLGERVGEAPFFSDLPARQQELLVERAVSDSTEPGICNAYALVPGWYYDKAGTGVAWVRRDGSRIVRHRSTHRLVGDAVGAWTECDADPLLMIPDAGEILVPRRDCRVKDVVVLSWPETLEADYDLMASRAVVRRIDQDGRGITTTLTAKTLVYDYTPVRLEGVAHG
jgi:hypothetical protein